MANLTESEFERLADETLRRMLDQLADLEDDRLDVELESGVLTITFEDDVRYVVNSHRAAMQIWMAAGSTAWHFSWTGEAWISARNGDELWSTVDGRISKKLDRPVGLRS